MKKEQRSAPDINGSAPGTKVGGRIGGRIGGPENWNKYYFENGVMRAFGGIKKYKFETWIHLTLEDDTEIIINPKKVLFAHVSGRKHYQQ